MANDAENTGDTPIARIDPVPLRTVAVQVAPPHDDRPTPAPQPKAPISIDVPVTAESPDLQRRIYAASLFNLITGIMKNWKTTLSGILAGLAQFAKTQWPEHATLFDTLTGIGLALVGVFAHDAKPSTEPS